MRRVPGRMSRLAILAAATSAAVAWVGIGGGSSAVAYPSRWTLGPCTVANDAQGIWEDAPGAGAGTEAAFFWVSNIVPADESCTWGGPVPLLPTADWPIFEVRVAANDGALFTARVLNQFGAVLVTTPAAVANGGFQILSVPIPPGDVSARVEVTLTDAPDGPVASRRTSTVIDWVQIRNAGGGIGYQESFSRAG